MVYLNAPQVIVLVRVVIALVCCCVPKLVPSYVYLSYTYVDMYSIGIVV